MIYLIKLIDITAQLAYMALFARVILSWIPHSTNHPFIELIYRVTNPILRPFQNLIPSDRLGIDLSPIFAFIAIQVVRSMLIRLFI